MMDEKLIRDASSIGRRVLDSFFSQPNDLGGKSTVVSIGAR